MSEQDEARRDLVATVARYRQAREDYERAVGDAKAAGIPNTEVARLVGMTEAGVRMMHKRIQRSQQRHAAELLLRRRRRREEREDEQ